MVVDNIRNRSLYDGLGSRIAAGLAYLAGVDGFREQTVEIDGQELYALFQPTTTEGETGRFYEAHRQYIDIQYLVSGEEFIRVTDVGLLKESAAYDAKRDVAFYDLAPGTDVLLRPGDFAVLFPHDAHLPKLAAGAPAAIRKIVVKVRV